MKNVRVPQAEFETVIKALLSAPPMPADKITDKQIVALVRGHFLNRPAAARSKQSRLKD